uniref:OBG-type G domain-containing protein n=1 Tax=Mus spicilegus TaxID=10103 RepID=A0A8C6I3F4_MUSSI
MPPKKGGDVIKLPPIIGRFGTSLKIGIVGLPNVGKSTFFNVLTNSQASAENFPFCTIDPSESRVPVPDERFDFLCQNHKPASKIPALLNVVDIAGLVKGAHNGQGLWNAFLSHISACDGIFHLTLIKHQETSQYSPKKAHSLCLSSVPFKHTMHTISVMQRTIFLYRSAHSTALLQTLQQFITNPFI